jgi:hypothetical protein
VQKLFILHYKRFCRHLKARGVHPLLGCILLIAAFIGLSELIFQKVQFAHYFYPVLSLFVLLKLAGSQRNEFLSSCFETSDHKKIRLVENLLASIPFVAFLLSKQLYIGAIATLLISALISPFTQSRQLNFVLPTPFYRYPFEFTIGFRGRFPFYIAGYLVAYFSIEANNFNLGIFTLLGIFVVSMGFYSLREPVEYVWIHSCNSAKFLLQKVKIATLYSLLPALPIVIAFSIVYPEKILFVLLAYGIGMLYMVTMVLAKYAHYPSEINIVYAVFLAISMFFPPLLIVVIPFFYLKAKSNLQPILK